MKPDWTALGGLSCAACNAASTAFDGQSIIGVFTPGGVMESLGRDDGAREWESPIGDGVHYQGTSTAGGVAYTLDGNGFLDAFDSRTGEPLLHRQMALDSGAPMVQLTSSGVAIAEHTVFVADTGTGNDGYAIAYGAGG